MNIDFSQVQTAEARAEEARSDRLAMARNECKSRITEVFSAAAQLNLAADAAAGVLNPAEIQSYKAWRVWVEEMRTAWPRLARSDVALNSDEFWPVVPNTIRDLARRY